MWSAFRSDLHEFVSTVTEESSNVLSKLDAGMSDDGGKSDDDLDNADSGERLDSEDDEEGGDGDDGGGGKKATAHRANKTRKEATQEELVNSAELEEIMDLLRDHPGTFTEDLANEENEGEVAEYLENFSIDSKTDEIANLLEEHPDTLKKNFEELCPTQVAYEDFWKRYFFRCDRGRIARQLQEETERERKERAEAFRKGITTVTNFFGGAATALSKKLAPDDGGAHREKSESGGINFFGAKGRPPFVMNTAMDESGDDVGEDDDDDDLGWDDEDEDEDLGLNNTAASANDSHYSDQIEFTDKVSEDLQKQLKQAVEERDQIQQTVKMQAEEIKSLQMKLELASSSGADDGDGINTNASNGNDGDVEALKMKLFETEAELAAVKARADDSGIEDDGGQENRLEVLVKELGKLPDHQLEQLRIQLFGREKKHDSDHETSEKLSALEQDINDLTQKLSSKEGENAQLQDKLQSKMQELEQKQAEFGRDQANTKTANATIVELQSKLETAEANVHHLQAENESLEKHTTSMEQERASELAALREEKAAVEKKVAVLEQQLAESSHKLQQAEDALKQKEKEVVAAAKESTRASTNTPQATTGSATPTWGAKSPAFATPALTSTPPASAMKIELDDEALEDDWGDDWD